TIRRHLRIAGLRLTLRLAPDDGVFRQPEQVTHHYFWKEFYVIRQRRRHKMRIGRICWSRRSCAVVATNGYSGGESVVAISGYRVIAISGYSSGGNTLATSGYRVIATSGYRVIAT